MTITAQREAQLLSIIRAVAAAEPMVHCPGDDFGPRGWYECGFCEVQANPIGIYEWADVTHSESCEWRRAVEWVAANGGSDVGS